MSTNLAPSLSGEAIDRADQRYGIFALSLDGAVGSQLVRAAHTRLGRALY